MRYFEEYKLCTVIFHFHLLIGCGVRLSIRILDIVVVQTKVVPVSQLMEMVLSALCGNQSLSGVYNKHFAGLGGSLVNTKPYI